MSTDHADFQTAAPTLTATPAGSEDADRWYNASAYEAHDDGPMSWDELLNEMNGFRGPVELVITERRAAGVNTSEILDKAADLIDKRGHAKRRHVTAAGCLCAAGAMFAAVGIEPDHKHFDTEFWPGYTPARSDLVKVAFDWFRTWLDRTGIDPEDPVHWNDTKERTKSEVVSTLRAAAEAARAET